MTPSQARIIAGEIQEAVTNLRRAKRFAVACGAEETAQSIGVQLEVLRADLADLCQTAGWDAPGWRDE